LRYCNQYAGAHSDNDLLRRNGSIVPLLDGVARQRTAERARHHRHVAAAAPADQAPNAETGQAADHCTDPRMMVVR
jgi:hypothetical protein